MTSTERPRIRRIGEERTAAETMQSGPQRDAALLHVEVLEYIRACQVTRDSGLSVRCNTINAIVNGVANSNRPYIKWECCGQHKTLKSTRERLTKRAAELGVELNLDMMQIIED